MIATRPSVGIASLFRSICIAALVASTLLCAPPALAQQPDLGRAEMLVEEGKYQEAYDLLAPFRDAREGDARFNYLLGRAALGTKRLEDALALLERSLAQRPNDVAAHLALGRAYYALGRYAEAKIEFETVLRFDGLPPDLESQVEIYDRAARQNLEEGRRLTAFGYAEIGIGRYRINSTSGTVGGERDNTFYNARVGGGLNYQLPDNYALDASLDYRFSYQDADDVRNDSDWRWRLAGSRAFGANNLAVGFRGRVSYRGSPSIYRNDYSIFTDYRYRLDENNQLTAGAELQRRRYPEGRLRERSRTTATASVGWLRSLFGGKGDFSLRGWGGYNYATSRPDGDSSLWGAEATLDYTFTDRLGGFVYAWWERNSFNTDRVHYFPDANDGEILRRRDNEYEFGASLVWQFARTWSLRPQIIYIRDQSNSVGWNYSSTEYWVNVRYAF